MHGEAGSEPVCPPTLAWQPSYGHQMPKPTAVFRPDS